MENAQNNLKNYALKIVPLRRKTLSPAAQFLIRRMELRDADEFIATLEKLEDLVQKGDLDKDAY